MPERALPIAPYATPADRADFFEFPVSAVHEEEVRDGVVGDEQIHSAVVVDVGCDNAPGLAEMLSRCPMPC